MKKENVQYVSNLMSNDAGLLVEGIALNDTLDLKPTHLHILRALADRFYGVTGHGYTLAGVDDLAAVTRISRSTVSPALTHLKALGLIAAYGTQRPRGVHASQRRGQAPTKWRFTPEFVIAGMVALEDAEVRRGVTTKGTLDRIRAVTVVNTEGDEVTTMRSLLPTALDADEQPENDAVSAQDGIDAPESPEYLEAPLEGEFPPDDGESTQVAEVSAEVEGEAPPVSAGAQVIPDWLSEAMEEAGHADVLARCTGDWYDLMIRPLLDIEIPAEHRSAGISWLVSAIRARDEKQNPVPPEQFAFWVRLKVESGISQAEDAAKPAHLDLTTFTLGEVSTTEVVEAFEAHEDQQKILDAVGVLVDTFPQGTPEWMLVTVLMAAKKRIKLPLTPDTVVRWLEMALNPEHAGMTINAALNSLSTKKTEGEMSTSEYLNSEASENYWIEREAHFKRERMAEEMKREQQADEESGVW